MFRATRVNFQLKHAPTSCVVFLCESQDEGDDEENNRHTSRPENRQDHYHSHPRTDISCKMDQINIIIVNNVISCNINVT